MSGGKKQKRKMKVKDAIPVLIEEEAARLINDEEVKQPPAHGRTERHRVHRRIDKVARRSDSPVPAKISREGVQRDLLPLVEGCTVNTRYGTIKTDHVLFIASGAFHVAKPSDLVPELQGRLPIRVELRALSVDDFKRILTEPDASLTEQYRALLATEGVTWNSARMPSRDWPKLLSRSTSRPRTSAPAACIPCLNTCWKRFPTPRPIAPASADRCRLCRPAPRRTGRKRRPEPLFCSLH
jgi:hypothetical protein